MGLIHSQLLTVTTGVSSTLTRFKFQGDYGQQGTINSLELNFDTLAGGANSIAKLTLSWVNADSRYLVNKETTLTLDIDADTATTGSYELSVNKEFNGIPAGATGIWLGVALNAGTANLNAFLHVRGHA